jgi:putative two-component system response regulator
METSQTHLPSILLVDDNTANLQVLSGALNDLGPKLLIAKNGKTALTIADKALPSLILLDIMMPEMDGYEVCRRLKDHIRTRDIPVIFVTAMTDEADEAKGLALGAVDYITKPINPELVQARVRNHLELKQHQDRLEELVAERTHELAQTQAVMIEGLATLAEYRDPETGGHIKRTQNYVKALANHLKDHPNFSDKLNKEVIELLYLSAPLHDVGKVGVRDDILLKPGRLTDEEFEIMKKHTTYGRDALLLSEQKLANNAFIKFARELAYTHHEKWDGSGYPEGIQGADISLPGRMMALADVYDALISKRVYKPPMPHEKAVAIIKEGKGSHFDPDIVEAFVELESTFRNIALTYADFDEEREMLGGLPSLAVTPCSIERILLVDDNEINLSIMQNQLAAQGYTVDIVNNGADALREYAAKGYDLVLTDLDMPVMDGYGLTREIRKREAGTGNAIPILAITASDYDLTVEQARVHGFSGYMLKPLDMDVFKKKLAEIK